MEFYIIGIFAAFALGTIFGMLIMSAFVLASKEDESIEKMEEEDFGDDDCRTY